MSHPEPLHPEPCAADAALVEDLRRQIAELNQREQLAYAAGMLGERMRVPQDLARRILLAAARSLDLSALDAARRLIDTGAIPVTLDTSAWDAIDPLD